ncbi:MAG: NAD-dependent epimerase/dehydratase family protein, partial [Gemmatimonadota bacterium]
VYTSGIWVLGETGDEAITEDDPVDPAELVAWRAELEGWVVAAAGRGVRTVVVRPGIVYGRGGGLPAMMARGNLPLIGEGENRWPVVHIDDVGRLYVAALERGSAGSVLHGVADHVRAREVAERLGAESVPPGEAREQMGAFADALALDQRVASEKTRDRVEWTPREPGILELSALELGGQT